MSEQKKKPVSNPFIQPLESFQAYEPKIEAEQREQVEDVIDEEIRAGRLPANIKYHIERGQDAS